MQFGPFTFDPGSHQLIRNGVPAHLAPKPCEILLLLAQNAGRVLTKEEIFRDVWPGVAVEEGNLTQQISLLRKTLGTTPDGNQYIETVPKAGYRFLVPVKPVPAMRASIPVRRGAWLLLAIAGALLLWALVFYWLGRQSAVPPRVRHNSSSLVSPHKSIEKIQRVSAGLPRLVAVQRNWRLTEVSRKVGI